MVQLTRDSFSVGEKPLTVEAAARLLAERVPSVPEVDIVPLADVDGRILAADVVAPIDLPGFDNAAVDGYAVRFADLSALGDSMLAVTDRIAAGHVGDRTAPPSAAVRIFTGAPMPAGFDTVFMQEDCRLDPQGNVVLPEGLAKGANARPRGEDVARGSVALAKGQRLAPEHVALAASLGLAALPVRRVLRVAIFSTGDEIMQPGVPPRAAGLYDANRYFMLALLKRLGVTVTDLGILRDKESDIQDALGRAAPGHDLILTSGGVSTGEEDHVKAAVAKAGALVFWRVAIKPGRPVALGIVGTTPFLGLPGNPVAVFITFIAIVRPVLAALAGEIWAPPQPLPVIAGFAHRKKSARREYLRVTLTQAEGGGLVAHKYPVEGAGVVTSLTGTDGLIELPDDLVAVKPGDVVGFLAYASVR